MIHDRYLRITRLDFDDEYAWHTELTASNGSSVASQDVYLAPNHLREFASQLRDFPTSIATFELEKLATGSPWFVRLAAIQVDALGHSALSVLMSNNGVRPHIKVQSEFSIYPVDPAQINRLGAELLSWVDNSFEPFIWAPR